MKRRILLLLAIFLIAGNLAATPVYFDIDPTLTIYPNPAREQITLKFITENAEKPEVTIIDMTGKTVIRVEQEMDRSLSTFETGIDISDLKAGIYFVKVIQGKENYTQKLVVR